MSTVPVRTGDAIEIPGGYQFDALHRGFVVQRFWHQSKLELVEVLGLPEPTMTVLDLGCGSGVVADFLALTAGMVHAIDGNAAAIEFAQGRFQRPNLTFRLGLVHELDFSPGTFDAIYLLEVIEHLYEQQTMQLLASLKPLLKPSGRLLLTTPDYHSAWPFVEWLMDVLHLAPRMKEHQHVHKLTRSRLRGLAGQSGFVVTRCFREWGLAPFCSVFGWRFAEGVRAMERRLKGPFGMLICAELRPS